MNIFVLDQDPSKAAAAQCDKHVIKMVLETAQLLCAAYEPGKAPYRRTHYNHPCAVWTRASHDNFQWLVEHGNALADEYFFRYGKKHKSHEIITWCDVNKDGLSFTESGLTPFAQAMPEEYKNPDPVVAYRTYYQKAKARIASWKPPSTPPSWWQPLVIDGNSN